jgi:hypothetical protein
MDEAIKQIDHLIQSGKSFAKRGLLYEAAYRYGQALMAMNMIYILHIKEVLRLSEAEQSDLTQRRLMLATLSLNLNRAAGNGHGHRRMGDADSDAKKSLFHVIEMLNEDIQSPPWFER